MRRNLIPILMAGVLLSLPLAAQRPRGPEIRVDILPASHRYSTQVAMAPNGDFVVVWQTGHMLVPEEGPSRIWLRLFRADGKPKTKQLRVSNARSDEMWPRLTMAADGSFLVVWQGGSTSDTSVFGRRFDAGGKPRGDRFRLSLNAQGSQEQPTAAFARDGSFVAAWVSHGHSFEDPWDVYARRFDAAGQPLGPEFLVSTESAEEQDTPQVALSASGDFLIGWVSWVGEGGFFDVLGRRFARDGAPQSDEILLNAEDNEQASQDELALGMREDGSFVVIWTDRTNDPGSGSLNGQRFAANGEPAGRPLQIIGPPGGFQGQPAIAMAADGSFFATWLGSTSPSSLGILGRWFASDGTPLGGVARIDRSAESSTGNPSVALGNDGRGVVVWLQESSKPGVYARRLVP